MVEKRDMYIDIGAGSAEEARGWASSPETRWCR